MRRGRSPITPAGLSAIAVALVAWLSSSPCLAEAVTLPQDHGYQKVLRAYLGSLKAADFAVDLKPVELRSSWVADDDQWHRMWILSRSFPDPTGLRLAPDRFLLSSIESPDGIRIRAGSRGEARAPGASVHADDTVWWSTWTYQGNPYRDSPAVRKRAFVVAAVDMIMLDRLHESGTHWVRNARRSDFLGGTLSWLAHVYHDVRADLPQEVREAYETGLEKFVDRLTEWGPTGVNENMDMKALVAMAYLSATLGEGPLADKADAYARRVLGLVHPAGMVRDAGGLEASYNGIALYSVAWAAAVAGMPEVLDAERRMTALKAHLALPEPDLRTYWGPSHFSTRTSADAASDQWAHPPRDLSIAMRCDEAMYLMHGGRNGRGPMWGAPSRKEMADEIRTAVAKLNATLVPTADEFAVWGPEWWASGRFNFAHDHYVPGFYARVRRSRDSTSMSALPPVARAGEPFVRMFPDPEDETVKPEDGDAFLVARFPDYAAVIYTGPSGFHDYMNFAGGSLSAFWTATGGAMILGRNGRPAEPEKSSTSWADWRSWPTHAISGQTASGAAFSSARIRREAAVVESDVAADRATVSIRGPIGKRHDKSRAAQNGCIVGDVRYARTFDVRPDGVVVETRLDSDGTDTVTELCETIPLFLHDAQAQVPTAKEPGRFVPHRVLFRVGEGWVQPGGDFVEGVSAVRIDRFAGAATIAFESPQRVRLGEPWTDNYQSAAVTRNVLVDLLGPGSDDVPLPSVAIRYRVGPAREPVAAAGAAASGPRAARPGEPAKKTPFRGPSRKAP